MIEIDRQFVDFSFWTKLDIIETIVTLNLQNKFYKVFLSRNTHITCLNKFG